MVTMNNKIRFIIYHDEAGSIVTDLDAIVNHAENLVNENLVFLLMDFTSELKSSGYDFKVWKEGEDK